ncbi:MAG: histidine phosphatase family protein [Actinomycetota bacterium]
MDLILVRHGRPHHIENADGPADPSLTALGHLQARAVAGRLATEPIDAVYSSPMNRAMETGAPLARLLDLELQIRHGVREYDAEDRSYIPFEVLRQDKERMAKFMEQETTADRGAFSLEVVETLTAIVKDHPSQRVVVFCHGGVVNVWASHVLGMEPKMFTNVDYTSINRFKVSSKGFKYLESLNDNGHLAALGESTPDGELPVRS